MNFWFTADQHLGHVNIIKYCNRPFNGIEEHDAEIIDRHNSVVQKDDVVIHAGDFCWAKNKDQASVYTRKLSGNHIFLRGCHDLWLPNSAKYMWRRRIDGHLIVVCHYAMRTWASSHFNSWQLYGHSHGRMQAIGKTLDIGVDSHNFYPWSFSEIVEHMKHRPDNPNFILVRKNNETRNPW